MIRNAYPFKPGRNAVDLSDKYKQMKVNTVFYLFSILIYTGVMLPSSKFHQFNSKKIKCFLFSDCRQICDGF